MSVKKYSALTGLLFVQIICIFLLQGCSGKNADTAAVEQPVETVSANPEVPADKAVAEEPVIEEDSDPTMMNVETEEAVAYSSLPAVTDDSEEEVKAVIDEQDNVLRTEDGKIIVDLIMFMGQSNMSGTGGNAKYAPKVEEGHGYEFRAISDPTRLYPIEEPFGLYENRPGAIEDMPIAKNGSLVSSFANKYYELTGVPVVAVSASSGGRDTDFWMSKKVVDDFSERQKRAQVWLESNDYYIRKQYVIWLQGESDAEDGLTTEQYNQNMDNIIRPLFIGGVQKVFMITPGRTITGKHFYDSIVYAQINMCRDSGYYALATTVLNSVSTEYMVDEFHYNQSVLNVTGSEAAESAAYYTLNRKEKCLYNYRDENVYIPDGFEYTEDEMKVTPVDHNSNGDFVRYENG